ncbi:hypothetical protein C8F01DRAFT_439982 [Mycena amicta]|nr:hypothetical protein C8F01DRAFT_439982 [Mycena amicta]
MPPTAYSGADLKARDKAIVEKHEKEKAVLEARYQRLRHGFDALSNENCDLQNRGENAATKLGFRSFAEMVAILRVSGDQVPYTKLVEHVENLEGRLANEEGKVETIRAERDDALEEKVLLHTELMEAREQAAKSKVLAEELHQTLEAAKERHKRADTEFKERFSKWRSFKRFMATEELQYKEKVKGLDEEQKDKEETGTLLETAREAA